MGNYLNNKKEITSFLSEVSDQQATELVIPFQVVHGPTKNFDA